MYKYLLVLIALVTVSCGTLEIGIESKSTPTVNIEPTSTPTLSMQATSVQPENPDVIDKELTPTPKSPTHASGAGSVLIPGPQIDYVLAHLMVAASQGSGVSAQTMPLADPNDSEHILTNYVRLEIIDYPAPDFHSGQPFIYISTIKDYENAGPDYSERAANAVSELKKLLVEQPAVVGGFDPLPIGIRCCAATVIRSQVHYFRFQNGTGVRMIASHRNGFSPISNDDLAYEFYGITDDGLYYVFASFPINAPILVNSRLSFSPSNEAPPAGGVPFPEDLSKVPAYNQQVEEKLNGLLESDFNPQLSLIDNLLESLQVK